MTDRQTYRQEGKKRGSEEVRGIKKDRLADRQRDRRARAKMAGTDPQTERETNACPGPNMCTHTMTNVHAHECLRTRP